MPCAQYRGYAHGVLCAEEAGEGGLIQAGKRGKEKIAEITDAGRELCEAYKQLRDALLVKPVKELGQDEAELSRLASVLRSVSGHYDQAARSAAAM